MKKGRAAFMGAALDLCLLSLVSRKPRYGQEMVALLTKSAVGPVQEGTVYPLLRRMEKDGLLEVRVVRSPSGPARNYYSPTPHGEAYLEQRAAAFLDFADGIKSIFEGYHGDGRDRR